jgi:hypothetical protein
MCGFNAGQIDCCSDGNSFRGKVCYFHALPRRGLRFIDFGLSLSSLEVLLFHSFLNQQQLLSLSTSKNRIVTAVIIKIPPFFFIL